MTQADSQAQTPPGTQPKPQPLVQLAEGHTARMEQSGTVDYMALVAEIGSGWGPVWSVVQYMDRNCETRGLELFSGDLELAPKRAQMQEIVIVLDALLDHQTPSALLARLVSRKGACPTYFPIIQDLFRNEIDNRQAVMMAWRAHDAGQMKEARHG